MVVEAVDLGSFGLRAVGAEHLGGQRRQSPDKCRYFGELRGTRLDIRLVPTVEGAQALIEAQWALLETAFHVALFSEGTIAVLGVVAGEGQVAEGVQPGFLHALPVGAESLTPAGGQILVLRQYVLDGVLVHRHALLAAVVLQAAKPIAAAREVIEIAHGEFPLKLLVSGKAAVGRQKEQVSLDAF